MTPGGAAWIVLTTLPPQHPREIRLGLTFPGRDVRIRGMPRYIKTLAILVCTGRRTSVEELLALHEDGVTPPQLYADLQAVRRRFGNDKVITYATGYELLGARRGWDPDTHGELAATSYEGVDAVVVILRNDTLRRLVKSQISTSLRQRVFRSGTEPFWIPPDDEEAETSPEGPPRHEWPLELLICTAEESTSAELTRFLAIYAPIVSHIVVRDLDEAITYIHRGRIDGLLLDIFSFEPQAAMEFLAWIRDRHHAVGCVILGTDDQLARMPGLSSLQRRLLRHYWRLPVDAAEESLAIILEDNILMLFMHWLSDGKFGDTPGGLARVMMRPEVAGSWTFWRDVGR